LVERWGGRSFLAPKTAKTFTRSFHALRLVRRPKSPYWIIRGTLRRIRIEESTGTRDRRTAEEIRAKREAEVLTQSIYGRRATATFADAALSYLENGGSKRFMEPVLQHFGTMPLAQIEQDEIDKGARKLYPDASEATRNRQFYTPVSAVLRHAARRGTVLALILERPFPTTKNGQRRGVPLHQRVVIALANVPHREGEVFRRPDGLPYERPKRSDDHSAGTRIKTAFKAACRRAGITDFHPHDCRHTWATWHYIANRDLGALKRLGGWKSVRMVMRYAHTNVDEFKHTIDRLPGGKIGDTMDEGAKTA
jgi:integrase